MTDSEPRLSKHKLLVANRGEIAVRIIRTATRLGLPTIAIFCRPDADAAHVLLASEAIAISPVHESDLDNDAADARGYMNGDAIIEAARKTGATLVHPGYGFLSENADFARKVARAGLIFLGPKPDVIQKMGLKDQARQIAAHAGVPVVPGSGLLNSVDEALAAANNAGFPVMLKAAGGGGGMGLVICDNASELSERLTQTKARAESLFHNDGVFLEKYVASSRHIEVQVFGNGHGHAIHMGERECSVQRRHQKVIEETPSPFMLRHPDLRADLCSAAVQLCQDINYSSAGTVEFLVNDETGEFYFLEMNTRLQVEHTITEQVNPGLDLVELMILQGVAEYSFKDGGLESSKLMQEEFEAPKALHSIEARVYCENPSASFVPTPGLLQFVHFPKEDWLRIDSWVKTGTTIPPFYDPLVCKLNVTGPNRDEAVDRMKIALKTSKIQGPPNNILYLKAIVENESFTAGNALTTFLDTFTYVPRAMTAISGGVETTIQDFPGRNSGFGIPPSGPMDSLSFRAANLLVGNKPGTEGLEICVMGPKLVFHTPAVIAITGATISVKVNGQKCEMWTKLSVPSGGRVDLGAIGADGFRAYVAVRGGFPEIPKYLGSKSTSMGMGGYQGRPLTAGDQLALGTCAPMNGEEFPEHLSSPFDIDMLLGETIYCLAGPQDDFVTLLGRDTFYSTPWKISASSNRMGIRLEGPKIEFNRENGGEGGSHPSNILDNGYALGSINMNGDTPVILTNEGPDMGGYLCIATICSADMWKVGQLRPGSTIRFVRIAWKDAMELHKRNEDFLRYITQEITLPESLRWTPEIVDSSSILHVEETPTVVTIRQAGDRAILIEFGEMTMDLNIRARVHLFETIVMQSKTPGLLRFAPCTRSTMCHYDPHVISQKNLLRVLSDVAANLPDTLHDVAFPGRKITLPIVLDDKWNREALQRYMRNSRDKAVYLPSNVTYLAKNNGFKDDATALKVLADANWITVGVGFYLGCPFLVPIDPRSRIIGQKMNPSRTFTPSGAIGIAGCVAAIYPVESPGGYQLYGRTIPGWQTWGYGDQFSPDKPWLINPFDQIAFEVIDEEEYVKIERQFRTGAYKFKIEPVTFSVDAYDEFVSSIQSEIAAFKLQQAEAMKREEIREAELLKEWELSKLASANANAKTEDPRLDDRDSASMLITANTPTLLSPLHASIASISPTATQAGHKISSASEVMILLEAMKTQINVEAGEENVGRVVKGLGGPGVGEGAVVKMGDVLVVFEDE